MEQLHKHVMVLPYLSETVTSICCYVWTLAKLSAIVGKSEVRKMKWNRQTKKSKQQQ